ncbi:FecR domain-containing protein [Caulobacter sp. UNC279MFTsu5.1]|uniref:FecR family protein n=1 Tax=Caulobacter sp. UNC279MFTsu5.1 TaxID=1502775 RepID=UPI00035C8013|nr:FecR domain-containing protein [Caulobacter sp. UNC279MFTsu5.1]SFK14247.1 FecR family protein [Caulobacter sp. UNC279MFTsu5.1]
MAERETSRDIDQAASDWTARLDRGPLTPEGEDAFQAWLRGDPRRRGALLRARALSLMSESAQALGPGFDPVAFEAPLESRRSRFAGLSRRQALTWTGGAAAAVAVTALGVGLPAAGAVISTERGEIRLAPLKDGSTVLLNTETRIRVRYSQGERLVTLLEGEAYFSVARDEKRPFVVEVDGRRLSTAQAGFRVRKLDADPVDVLVNQGQVDVAASPTANGVALKANTQLALSGPAERPRPVGPEAVTRELAWRDGKLAFEGESLDQAAAAFARYSDTRIQIRDPALAREPVTGLFAANDPAGFSRAIARVFDAKVEQEGGDVVLTRGAPRGAGAH